MLKSEFTERTKMTISDEEFEEVHAIYMATQMPKDSFCAYWCEVHHDVLFNETCKVILKKIEQIENLQKEKMEIIDFMLERAQVGGDKTLLDKAIELTNYKYVIQRKIALDLPLWEQ